MSTARTQSGAPVAQIYLVGAVACALISVGAYFLGVRPAMARHTAHIILQAELRAAKQNAATLQGSKNGAQIQLNAVNEALKNQTLRLQPASTVNERVASLTDLAEKGCGLQIEEMRALAVTEGPDYVTVPIQIAGGGTYSNCAKFLHRLRKVFPDTAVRSFQTTNNSASPDSPSATFQFELVWHAAKG